MLARTRNYTDIHSLERFANWYVSTVVRMNWRCAADWFDSRIDWASCVKIHTCSSRRFFWSIERSQVNRFWLSRVTYFRDIGNVFWKFASTYLSYPSVTVDSKLKRRHKHITEYSVTQHQNRRRVFCSPSWFEWLSCRRQRAFVCVFSLCKYKYWSSVVFVCVFFCVRIWKVQMSKRKLLNM